PIGKAYGPDIWQYGIPTAEEEHDADHGDEKHHRIFSQENKRKPEPTIFRMETAHQFRFCLRDVERGPVTFRKGGNKENHIGNPQVGGLEYIPREYAADAGDVPQSEE